MQPRILFAFRAAMTLLTLVQLGVYQDLHLLFYRPVFQLGSPQHVLVHGVVPSQVQDSALLLAELCEVPISFMERLVKQDDYLIFPLWVLLTGLLLSKYSIPVQHRERVPQRFTGEFKVLPSFGPRNLNLGRDCLRAWGQL